MERSSRGKLVRLLVILATSSWIIVSGAPPAFALCNFDTDNDHTIGSAFHGWDRWFCQPPNDYRFTVFTNHPHGQKYAALWHDGTTHLHCDVLVSGSANASCTDTLNNTNHYSYHEISSLTSCTDRFSDGHGFNCHSMESLP